MCPPRKFYRNKTSWVPVLTLIR